MFMIKNLPLRSVLVIRDLVLELLIYRLIITTARPRRGPWVIRPINFQSKLKIENRCQFLISLSFPSREINKRVSRNISSFSRV